MRSKLTLSVDKQTIRKAKALAKERDSTVSQMFTDFVNRTSQIEEKLNALEKVSGIVDADLAAEPEQEYKDKITKKHGW